MRGTRPCVLQQLLLLGLYLLHPVFASHGASIQLPRTLLADTGSGAAADVRAIADVGAWISRVEKLRKQQRQFVIYNRIRKTGSSTMLELTEVLTHKRNFEWFHHREEPPPATFQKEGKHRTWARKPQHEEVKRLIDYVQKRRQKYLDHSFFVDYHWFYADWDAHGLNDTRPEYINIVREPIGRAVSAYYYDRYYPGRKQSSKKAFETRYGLLEVDECVELYDKCGCQGACANALACTNSTCADLYHNLHNQFMYFCPWGHPDCQHLDSRTALERAKATAANSFAVVGVLEQHRDTLKMLEVALPKIFKGAARVKVQDARVNHKKSEPSPKALARMREIAALELEFYDFVVDMFKARKSALKNQGLWP